MFTTIIAIIKAIPAIKAWWDQLVTLYYVTEVHNMQAADRAAIKKAMEEHDQRDLENQLGNSQAGEKSNLPGTVIRDKLPGVP